MKNQNDKNNLQEDMLENYKRFSQQLHDSLIVVQTLLYKIIYDSCIDVLRNEKCKDPELKNKIIIKLLEEYVPHFVNEASKQINHFQTIYKLCILFKCLSNLFLNVLNHGSLIKLNLWIP